MESSLCSSDGLLEPSLPSRTQPDPGAAPAIYRPPLFQVGNHKKGQYGVETVATSVFPVVNHHQRHQCVKECLKFLLPVQVLERVVQPLRQRDASSAVCRGLPERHQRRDAAVGRTAGLPQAGKTKLNKKEKVVLP